MATRSYIRESFSLAGSRNRTFDPFHFVTFHHDEYPPGLENMGIEAKLLEGRPSNEEGDFTNKDGWSRYFGHHIPGFPVHQHRGFETISIVRQGTIDHFDSLKGSGRYGAGDVQWMTAGKGIQHSEMLPLLHQDAGNPVDLVQIWLLLPRKDKLCPPACKMMWSECIPVVELLDVTLVSTEGEHQSSETSGQSAEVGRANVVAGTLGGQTALQPPPRSWASNPDAHVAIWDVQIPKGVTIELPPAAIEEVTRVAYFKVCHSIRVYVDHDLPLTDAAAWETLRGPVGLQIDPTKPLRVQALHEKAELMLMQGKPIGEKNIEDGPYVMNTPQEIKKCHADFERTKFGGWPWPVEDPVHPRDAERHAVFPGGRRSTPETALAGEKVSSSGCC